ncbi:MAG: hypothetical protein ACRDOO_25485 [Actinomadura sp.]
MGTEVVRRHARKPSPALPSGELVLEAPPEIPLPGARQWTQMLFLLPMVAITGMVLLNSSSRMSRRSGTSTCPPTPTSSTY